MAAGGGGRQNLPGGDHDSQPAFGGQRPVTLEVIPAIAFFTNNDDFLDGKTLEQDPISVQGHLIYEVSPVFWAAFDATYYAGGRTTIDGEKGEQPENVRLGRTTALSMSRHQYS